MKRILALAFLVSILAVSSALASPENNPNGTPAAIASDILVNMEGFPDLPGFAEVGQFLAMVAQEGEGNGIRGLSELAPGRNEEPPV